MRHLPTILLLLALAAPAWGAESCTATTASASTGALAVTTYTWTAAADGSLSACAAGATDTPGIALAVETDPGATAPTAAYDLTITDAGGNDVMGGALADRSASATERAAPLLTSATEWPAPFKGPLTLNLSNNSVDSATGVVRVYWLRK